MDKDEAERIRKETPIRIAEALVSVQPMPNIDFEALARDPFVQQAMYHLVNGCGDKHEK